MYAYELSPIDNGWEHLKTVEETMQLMLDQISGPNAGRDCLSGAAYLLTEAREFVNSWRQAQKLAKQVGWEGDFTQEPHVFWLPEPGSPTLIHGFIIKQANNGTTFVISPVPLMYLETDCMDMAED